MIKRTCSCFRAISKAMDSVIRLYTDFLLRHPFIILAITGVISGGLTALSGYIFVTSKQGWDPQKGFEARGTKFSSRGMAFDLLRQQISSIPSEKPYSRRARSIQTSGGPKVPAWAKMLAYSLLSTPCGQLSVEEVQYMEYLVQVVFEVDSVESLFTVETMKELCGLSQALEPNINEFDDFIIFRNLWSLPEYAVCFAADERESCNPTKEHIDKLFETLKNCNLHRTSIVQCQKGNLAFCDTLPKNCSEHLIGDLFYRILPVNFFEQPEGPLYINTFLPMFTFEAYRYRFQKPSNINISMYDHILENVEKYSANQKNIRFVGIQTGTKLYVFDQKLGADTLWGFVASILVFCFILGYSGSIFYTFMVSISLLFSVGISYAVYTYLFGVSFFPFMNLLVVVLLVGIGADDTFVLNYIFACTKKEREQKKDEKISAETLFTAFSHAALSMFVTSATTAAAFYANMVSSVINIRCFGIFAGTTMMVNYLLVITWLPACLIIMDNYINPCFRKLPCVPLHHMLGFISSIRKLIGKMPKYLIQVLLLKLVDKLRWLWIILISFVIFGSGFVMFKYPGLSLPERNPMQVFKSSHPIEWYDGQAELYFPFASAKYDIPISIAVVWGFLPITDASFVNPDDTGTFLQRDPAFVIDSIAKVQELSRLCQSIVNDTAITEPSERRCWITRFLRWSSTLRCSINKPANCCNVSSEHFKPAHLHNCVRYFSKIIQNVNDWPIFLNDSSTMVGYEVRVKTIFKFSVLFKKLYSAFSTMERTVDNLLASSPIVMFRHGWFSPTMKRMLTWYELLTSLFHGTPISVVVSITVALVVVVLSTRTILISAMSIITICGVILTTIASIVLLGWTINVVESTIIILTVGLSFDFTLHYAVAYKLSPKGSRKEKVAYSFQFIGIPVCLSAMTTFCAGAAMVPSATSAFYEIGVFMMLVTGCSWFYSSVYFMSLMICFGPEDQWMAVCCDETDDEETTEPPVTDMKL